MAVITVASVHTSLSGFLLDTPLIILTVSASVVCAALWGLWSAERSGSIDTDTCMIAFYVVVVAYVVASAVAIGILLAGEVPGRIV